MKLRGWLFDPEVVVQCKCLCNSNHGSQDGCDFYDAPVVLMDEDGTIVTVCSACAARIPKDLPTILHDLIQVLRC
jgi:hypothetical protein